MPWKETDPMLERASFIHRLETGERMTDLCREYGISRKTGYKLRSRFRELGSSALLAHSSRPFRSPNKTPQSIAQLLIDFRIQFPSWGPKKIKHRLEQLHPGVKIPAASTIGHILGEEGLLRARKKRRRATPTSSGNLRQTYGPNELWCIDYKGQFRLTNRQYCYPLTLSDHFSRFLLVCDAQECTKTSPAQQALLLAFAEFGLPTAIRSDNGSPFASTGVLGFTRLSVWLLRLGIELERIEPGKPQQNGRHERIHLTMAEAVRPAAANIIQQQERFDNFVKTYNEERPHEALKMKTPASLYNPSERRLPSTLEPLDYPLHDFSAKVHSCGNIRFRPMQNKIYLGQALQGEYIGLREITLDTWLVSFMDFDLGYIDIPSGKFLPAKCIENTEKQSKVSPTSPV